MNALVDLAFDSIRAGAPGLSDATCKVIAASIARKAALAATSGGGEVDWDDAPLNTPIWCVYGAECFPTVFACQIKDHPQVGRVIWGFSIYRRASGYRTLGTGREWAVKNDAHLFLTQADAFAHISNLFQQAAR